LFFIVLQKGVIIIIQGRIRCDIILSLLGAKFIVMGAVES